jgi:hypothetical protein
MTVLLFGLLSIGSAWAQDEAPAATDSGGSLQRSNRMEFDERLIRGQTATSGAVYLFDRAPRELPGLVPLRRSYRAAIVEPVLGDRELKPAVYSTESATIDWAPMGSAP